MTSGLLMHHENASVQTAVATRDFIADKPIRLISHPSYF